MIATDLLDYVRRIINSTEAVVPYDNFSNSGMKVGKYDFQVNVCNETETLVLGRKIADVIDFPS